MHIDRTPSQIKQMLHHLELDAIYWRGLQQYSTNPAIQSMATTNLANTMQSKDKLLASLKRPKNLFTSAASGPTYGKPMLTASFDGDRKMRETIESYLQAHKGDDYRPSSIEPD
jgi:hypothetical protein